MQAVVDMRRQEEGSTPFHSVTIPRVRVRGGGGGQSKD